GAHFGLWRIGDRVHTRQSRIDAGLVLAHDLHHAAAVYFVDRDVRARFGLDLLDHTATGSDHRTDRFLRDLDGDDARCMFLVILAWLVQHLHHFTQNVQA